MWGSEAFGVRHLRSLVASLPNDSAFVRHIEPQASRWTTTDYLLANLIELTDAYGWKSLEFTGRMRKGSRHDPVRITRPGVEEEKPKALAPGRVSAQYAQYVKYVPS